MYKIVKASDHYELTKMVNELLDEGWVPQGGVALGRDFTENTALVQAMTYTSTTGAKSPYSLNYNRN